MTHPTDGPNCVAQPAIRRVSYAIWRCWDLHTGRGGRGRGTARGQGDEGTGLIALSAGVLVFLGFVLFAMQLLIGLHARTSVNTAAFDGARMVATAPIDHRDPNQLRAEQSRAELHVRRLLGRMGSTATIDWRGSTPESIAIRVRVDPPRFLLPGLSSTLGNQHLDHTARVRIEQLR